MARAVVLDFKDDQAAEMFMELLLRTQEDAEYGDPIAMSTILAAHAKPVALLPRPVRGCECHRKGRVQGWTRAEGTGWYVCPLCFKPHKTVVRNWYVNLCMQSKNQLKKIKDKVVVETNPPEVADSDNSGGSLPPADTSEGSIDAPSQDSDLAS